LAPAADQLKRSSSRQFLELRPKAERIEGGGKGEPPPTVAIGKEFEFFRKRAPIYLLASTSPWFAN